ncbi:hypothetical protein A3F07_00950 [candidate division WWE3 bacterium RIFCSPHIGHO2_12_FULL_38_15]|uniref:Glycosyl transferase family 1 domain-containing protein n=1 Tax=candidate division WWE3 bacterium RIFCSPHIGHO2_02_FULL_38_14 TaxID=1802620 RepID=A0A1F4VBJ6_UNCKA|nr:MAG: hypothetical protein A2793_03850 [candidate division WWE3 bacterium RIFCSPHIGHO2_01_FULL_38_45]OGC49142.1 MAG: hypothetical protein A3F07_00950 [candidate division WWE3 bacterium RIFCSPHIGHO2_12_FULL_38_15]OGC52592.1 MAG: hypothetical protein A3B64_03455 [candidate division WWE3 bacterium RIFCSPLOWO2_01_FULL_37_24]OGC54083.1 MAG: hypothetical protein A3D91_04980 [candidate division WWE3 bacterium RIFCSPHIGHO2_02_FULL_38_14]HLB51745.1 glycosyltransferase [Patescibacteria group bacterium]
MDEIKYNIICLSNQLWDFPNWTNKRHVMSRLAKRGHNVLFVDPPLTTGKVFYRQVRKGKWSLSRSFTSVKLEDGVKVFTPLNYLPFFNLLSRFHSSRLKYISKLLLNSKRKTILWVYHVEIPGLQNYINMIPHDLLIYDCVDNYEAFPKYDTEEKKKLIREQEGYLAKKADIVFATTPGLTEKLKKYNSRVYFTPNVGDYERFHDAKKFKDYLPEDIKDIPRPRIGFSGSLDEYKFDANLMRNLAYNYPNYSFVLIGQIAYKDSDASLEKIGLGGLNNIYFLGEKPFESMPMYYAGFDAYIIPYQLNEYTVGGCFPVKFHEALAVGIPTVVTDLPAYMPFKDVCYIAKNNDEFLIQLKKALDEDNNLKIKERKEIAKQNNWDGKVDSMLDYIGEFLNK